MVVGCLELTLLIQSAQSLKDKRSVVRRCIERAKNKFNVAVAEVGANDEHGRAILGFTTVANDRSFVNSVLDKVQNQVEDDALGLAEVVDRRFELINF
jgi:uncharacterized protein YlxP (DUF503 family)